MLTKKQFNVLIWVSTLPYEIKKSEESIAQQLYRLRYIKLVEPGLYIITDLGNKALDEYINQKEDN